MTSSYLKLAASPKSKGHISFARSRTRLLELYQIEDGVYYAYADDPVMPDGYRAGSFLCLKHRLDSFLKAYGLVPLSGGPIDKSQDLDIQAVDS